MASEIEVRVEKFNNLKEAGKNPFEITKFDQTHHTDEAKALYDELEAQLLGDRPEVDVEGLEEQEAGERIRSISASGLLQILETIQTPRCRRVYDYFE